MFINLRRYKFILLGLGLALFFIIGHVVTKEDVANPEPQETGREYGEYLEWSEVNKIFPKYARAKVIDFETGSSFNVQRRAGSYHADVQPLTAQDTAIMKEIYGGKWSWKRRAIILELENGRKLAASMHGMPHGAGSIPNNNFKGHFCIHFRGSMTHGSRKADLAHQIMIWKAAGIVEQQLSQLEERQIVEVFFTALDQNDRFITGSLLPPGEEADKVLHSMNSLANVKVEQIKKLQEAEYKVTLRTVFQGSGREYKSKVDVQLISGPQYYLIHPEAILKMLTQKVAAVLF